MNWDRSLRQVHRWLSIVFTLAVVAVSVVAGTLEAAPEWVYLTPLAPLLVLMFTGLYLFVLPYRAKGATRRRAEESAP